MPSRQTLDATSSSGFDYVSGEAQFAAQAQQQDIKLINYTGYQTQGGVISGVGTSGAFNQIILTVLPPVLAVTGGGPGVAPTQVSGSGATESGTTVTLILGSPHGMPSGFTGNITVSNVGGNSPTTAAYNGTFAVTGTPTPYSVTYTTTGGLPASGGGQISFSLGTQNTPASALAVYGPAIVGKTIRGLAVGPIEFWDDRALWDTTNSRYLHPGQDFEIGTYEHSS